MVTAASVVAPVAVGRALLAALGLVHTHDVHALTIGACVIAGTGTGAAAVTRIVHSRAVQVDPIKPTLIAPGTKRLTLKHDDLLSSSAFKFKL